VARVFLLFFVLWIIFNGQVTLEICLFGLGISAVLYLFVWKVMGYRPENDWQVFRRALGMLHFAGLLVKEICKSCLVVVKMIYTPRLALRPQLVKFSPSLHRDNARTALADAITLTPGTITVEAGEEGFMVHALDASLAEGLEDSAFVKLLMRLEHWEERKQKGETGRDRGLYRRAALRGRDLPLGDGAAVPDPGREGAPVYRPAGGREHDRDHDDYDYVPALGVF